jgi:hypothetical protein
MPVRCLAGETLSKTEHAVAELLALLVVQEFMMVTLLKSGEAPTTCGLERVAAGGDRADLDATPAAGVHDADD